MILDARFLHFPKAGGVSFASSVIVHGGSEMLEGERMRRHMALNASTDPLRTIVALFRHPEERLLSTYWYVRQHAPYCCDPDEFGYTAGQYKKIIKAAKTQPPTLPAVAIGSFTGCMTNMLLGHRCFTRPEWYRTLSWQQLAALAKARVDRMRFVGLVSEWLLSICLYNYQQTGVRCAPKARNTRSKCSNRNRRQATC